jgi:hypothetical protein
VNIKQARSNGKNASIKQARSDVGKVKRVAIRDVPRSAAR